MLSVIQSKIAGVTLFQSPIYRDDRGYFLEVWKQPSYCKADVPESFTQDNLSFSTRGVLRGLHFQHPKPQGKLVCPLHGIIYDVVVDLRRDSKTFGEWEGFTLNAELGQQIYVPEGFAHGFMVLSETALVLYKCTDVYNGSGQETLLWDDPELGIPWPVTEPILSEKDRKGKCLAQIKSEGIPY